MSSIGEILARDGVIVYRTKGTSMEPMLRQNRDLVTIRVPSSRLQKYDVALYRRGEDCILHRVIGFEDGGYRIRGDNTWRVEHVPEADVIGVLTEFTRKGKAHRVTDPGCRLYARVWTAVYPVRALVCRPRMVAGRLARLLGLKRGKRHA